MCPGRTLPAFPFLEISSLPKPRSALLSPFAETGQCPPVHKVRLLLRQSNWLRLLRPSQNCEPVSLSARCWRQRIKKSHSSAACPFAKYSKHSTYSNSSYNQYLFLSAPLSHSFASYERRSPFWSIEWCSSKGGYRGKSYRVGSAGGRPTGNVWAIHFGSKRLL
jgi:hypothetical protein